VADFLETPDKRYIVVRGRLWRAANPALSAEEHGKLVHDLMTARRAVKYASSDKNMEKVARQSVDVAKTALGERGPVWWTDGAPDFNRHLVKNTPYAGWFADYHR
jgi:hypothetical protein